jgi:uncharacterized protein YfaS (alpha-2-macroglobulin family)
MLFAEEGSKLKAVKLGRHSLTVRAGSRAAADAVKRELTVFPNGRQESQVANGTAFDGATAKFNIPRTSIPGTSRQLAKLYPGVLSQVVDGLDGLLQVPYGCFEQTSSITYPNVLIMKYLRATKKDKPGPMMKAEKYISLGYQKLLTFEVDGGSGAVGKTSGAGV